MPHYDLKMCKSFFKLLKKQESGGGLLNEANGRYELSYGDVRHGHAVFGCAAGPCKYYPSLEVYWDPDKPNGNAWVIAFSIGISEVQLGILFVAPNTTSTSPADVEDGVWVYYDRDPDSNGKSVNDTAVQVQEVCHGKK